MDLLIESFEPRVLWKRHEKETDVVFSTPHLGFAAAFMVSHDKSRDFSIKIHSFDFGPLLFICNKEEEFLETDKGGAIYILPSKTFYCDIGLMGISRKEIFSEGSHLKMGSLDEWVSKEAVKPLHKIEFQLTLQAMIDFGVQVYFTDDIAFQKLRKAIKDPSDKVTAPRILSDLLSENQRQNKNIIPLFNKRT